MKANQKKKVITLLLTIVVLAAVGAGAWILTHRGTNIPPNEPVSEPEQTPSNVQNTPSTSDPMEVEPVNDSLILVRGGTFTMGSPASERQRDEDEAAHEVTVSDFYADPYEVTQADYERIMGGESQPFHWSRSARGQRDMV